VLPPRQHPGLNRAVLGFFLVVVVAHLPLLLSRANEADARLGHTIPSALGDDADYQVLAVNMLHGAGYSSWALLPESDYRLDGVLPRSPVGDDRSVGQFRRSPGFSLMLAAVYSIAGTDPIVARRTIATLTWLTGVLLLATGAVQAGWIGSLAGGAAALYHLNVFPGTYNFERLLSESPTAFWVALFAFLFTLFLKRRQTTLAIGSALSLAAVILMRVNFLPVLPLLAAYLLAIRHPSRSVLMFVLVACIPITVWSAYASASMGRLVLISEAGSRLFANTNNTGTLEGEGANRSNQGLRSPVDGAEVDGWNKGLRFWRENASRVPELFYVKLRAGFWFADGLSLNRLRPERFFLVGVAYVIVALGFLSLTIPWPAAFRFNPETLLAPQVAGVMILFVIGNKYGLFPVLMVWTILLALSILRWSGPQPSMPAAEVGWFAAFVASHAITTMVFYGVRFHFPLDSNLMLIAFLGTLLTLHESSRRQPRLCMAFGATVFLAVVLPVLKLW
jgi:hypothetical protein